MINLYPSSCVDPAADVICANDNPGMIEGAKIDFAQQASAFEPVANITAAIIRSSV